MTVITNRRGRSLWRFIATTALAVGLTGCDDLVEYSEPERVGAA